MWFDEFLFNFLLYFCILAISCFAKLVNKWIIFNSHLGFDISFSQQTFTRLKLLNIIKIFVVVVDRQAITSATNSSNNNNNKNYV